MCVLVPEHDRHRDRDDDGGGGRQGQSDEQRPGQSTAAALETPRCVVFRREPWEERRRDRVRNRQEAERDPGRNGERRSVGGIAQCREHEHPRPVVGDRGEREKADRSGEPKCSSRRDASTAVDQVGGAAHERDSVTAPTAASPSIKASARGVTSATADDDPDGQRRGREPLDGLGPEVLR